MALDTAVRRPPEAGARDESRATRADALIRLVEVSKVYHPGGLDETRALDQVDLEIQAGEFVAVTGPSGSGKTTLMNVLGCLDPPTEGTYFLDGVDVSTYSARELARIRGQKIGCVFQSFNLIPRTTAISNVELPLVYAGVRDRAGRARAVLGQVGLADRMKHLPSQLSGGQQQRVCIARALVADPVVLLADEPTGALDSVTGGEIIRLLLGLHDAGRTVVVMTHDKEITRVADRVIHLRDGEIVPLETL